MHQSRRAPQRARSDPQSRLPAPGTSRSVRRARPWIQSNQRGASTADHVSTGLKNAVSGGDLGWSAASIWRIPVDAVGPARVQNSPASGVSMQIYFGKFGLLRRWPVRTKREASDLLSFQPRLKHESVPQSRRPVAPPGAMLAPEAGHHGDIEITLLFQAAFGQ